MTARLDDEEKRVIRELIDGMILNYQARRWAGSALAPVMEASSKRKAYATTRR